MKVFVLYTILVPGMFAVSCVGEKHATKVRHHKTGKVDKDFNCGGIDLFIK